MSQQPYVSRPEAEEFLDALDKALKAPAENPVVFHVWGIGGIGKSTLLRKVVEEFPKAACPLVSRTPISPISFGQTEGISTPVDLMRKLHSLLESQSQFVDPSFFGRSFKREPDPFTERYTQYFDAIHELQKESPDGKTGASAEQLGLVKQLLKGLTQGGGALATATGNLALGGALVAASKGTDAVVDGASLALSEKDRIQSLVQSHRATREKRDLQELLLNPWPLLTEAFVKRLGQWSEQKPLLLMLDTYEKADLSTIDTWLWRTLLSNTNIRRYPIRLLIAGRYNLLNRQEWATVQQNGELVKPFGPKKFTPEQTQAYLEAINITDSATIQQIHRVTQGWPYYLNKIREKPQGITPDSLAKGLAEFLVNHLPDAEQLRGKRLAQIAACCLSFNSQMIHFLAQQLQLESLSPRNPQAQGKMSCFDWLTEQTFVEPVSGGQWRVDDVARDVFRASLWQEDQPLFERTHDLLARYFKTMSDRASVPSIPTSEKYENPDWRVLRAEYLYHLLFTCRQDIQVQYVSHLFEGFYLKEDSVTRQTFSWMLAEIDLSDTTLLSYSIKKFLTTIKPAVEYIYLVFDWSIELDENSYDKNDLIIQESVEKFLGNLISFIENPALFNSSQKLLLNRSILRCKSWLSAMNITVSSDQELKETFQELACKPIEYHQTKSTNQMVNQFVQEVGLTLTDIEASVEVCFRQIPNLKGLAKCAALIYKAKRLHKEERNVFLEAALDEIRKQIESNSPDFLNTLTDDLILDIIVLAMT
jgi:hypothetical protein